MFLLLLLVLLSLFAQQQVRVRAVSTQQAEIAALQQQVEELGQIRVIVQLDVPFVPESELTVARGAQLQQQVIDLAQQEIVAALPEQAAVVTQFETIPFMALEVDAVALEMLLQMPGVIAVEQDVPVPAMLSSSVPVIGGDTAWANGFTGAGQTVAILDTGVDTDHPAFTTGGSRIVEEACFSTDYGSSYTVCPNGLEQQIGAGAGIDCTAAVGSSYSYAQSLCSHGTHVASIAAGDNGGSVVGVAPEANIISVQIFSLFTSSTSCYGLPNCVMTWSSDQIAGLEYVYQLRDQYDIAAVNMSLGGGKYNNTCDSDSRKAIIDNLAAAGIATVIASGNNGYTDSVSAPACISSAVSVGATTDSDDIASYSNVGPTLDLLAPGSSIYAAVPNGYGTKQGTSMATPHVTGAWALYKQAAPGAAVDDVLDMLQATGTPVDDGRYLGTMQNMPRINIDEAISQYEPILSVELTALSDYLLPGDMVELTLTVTNNTNQTATGVVAETAVPSSTTLQPASLNDDAVFSGIGPGSELQWQIGQDLPPGAGVSRQFSLAVDAAAQPGTLDLIASAFAAEMSTPGSSSVTLNIMAVAACDVVDGFENGSLADYWSVESTNDGRVWISDLLPASGNFHLVLDDAVSAGDFSEANLILTVDLADHEQVDLSFDWRNLGDEYHDLYDGLFIRDEIGGSWVKVYDFIADSSAGYQSASLNIAALAAQNGLALSEQFQVRFSFYDNFSFDPDFISGGDGYALDNVAVRCGSSATVESVPVDPQESAVQTISIASGMLTVNIPPGTLPANAAQLEFVPHDVGYAAGDVTINTTFSLNLRDSSGTVIPHPEFAEPLQLVLHYNDAYLPGDQPEELLTFRYYNPGTAVWELLPIAMRDLDGDCLIVELFHFSDFALMGAQQLFLPSIVRG